MNINTFSEYYFRVFAHQKWNWELDDEDDEDDDIVDNIIKIKQGDPTGMASQDYKLYHDFISSDEVIGDVTTYPALTSAIHNKIMNAIANFLVETLDENEDYEDFDLEDFENEPWVQDYFRLFPGLTDIFERKVNPPPPPPLIRASIVPGGDSKSINTLLNKQPVSILKMILKNGGYKGYSKLNKKQLISFIKINCK